MTARLAVSRLAVPRLAVPRRNVPRRAPPLLVLALALAAALGACVTTRNTFPPPGATPAAIDAPTTERTVATVIRMLGDMGMQADISSRPFRPVEGPLVAAAPRTVIEVKLPNDPAGAFVVVYSFASPEAALTAAEDHAAYLAAPIGGGVQYPPGTRFTIQVTQSNVVFFSWLPSGSDSPKATIEETLRSLERTVEVPS